MKMRLQLRGSPPRPSVSQRRRSPAAPILRMGPRAGQGSLPRVASPPGGLRAAFAAPRTAGSSGARRGPTDTWWHFLHRRQERQAGMISYEKKRSASWGCERRDLAYSWSEETVLIRWRPWRLGGLLFLIKAGGFGGWPSGLRRRSSRPSEKARRDIGDRPAGRYPRAWLRTAQPNRLSRFPG